MLVHEYGTVDLSFVRLGGSEVCQSKGCWGS